MSLKYIDKPIGLILTLLLWPFLVYLWLWLTNEDANEKRHRLTLFTILIKAMEEVMSRNSALPISGFAGCSRSCVKEQVKMKLLEMFLSLYS